MASSSVCEIVVRGDTNDSSNARDANSVENSSTHKMSVEEHESPFDTTDDDTDKDDEGGIPAWVAMRRSQKKPTSRNHERWGPSSAYVTADISLHNSPRVHADHRDKDNDKDLQTVVNLECDSESSGNRDELTPTTPEFEPYPYLEDESTSIPASPTRANRSDISNRAQGDPQSSVEHTSGSCKVIRGGFKLVETENRPKTLKEGFLAYPPTSNRGYMLTSTGHDPKFVLEPEQATATFIPRSCIQALRDSLLKSKPKLVPDTDPSLALGKSGDEDHWVNSEGVVSGGGSTGSQGQDTPDTDMLCGKCGTHHIPSGWLCSLGERDTCGSYLPDWFPTEKCEYPWLYFTDLCNDIHRLESLERGYTTQPPRWNKIYHAEHPVWTTLGLERGGWWRCRSGANAPRAERLCYDCHIKQPLGDAMNSHEKFSNHETMAIAMETLKELREFVDSCMHRVGQRDKVIALDMIRDSMTPRATTPQNDLHTFGIGRASHVNKDHGMKEEHPPRTEERTLLEAIWNHQGPLSTLSTPIPSPYGFSGFPEHELNNEYEEDEEGSMMMMSTIRQRPTPPSFHRSTSSLSSRFFSAFISPLSPRTPLSPGIPEEDRQISQQ
ncbi:hypothetical protein VTL71DRAFT_9116 [Oculimacula yallundae]|uniref:Uncharacterized protein n=1 Tax=Oculimacula yallundae TaxID=86028 RepID=A0ABR4BTU1_9HELO